MIDLQPDQHFGLHIGGSCVGVQEAEVEDSAGVFFAAAEDFQVGADGFEFAQQVLMRVNEAIFHSDEFSKVVDFGNRNARIKTEAVRRAGLITE